MKPIIVTESHMVELRKLEKVYITDEDRKSQKRKDLARLINKTSGSLYKSPKKKQVADHFYFFSNDSGFSYFGKETIADMYDVSVRTVEETMSLLKKNDEIIVAYRVNPKSNGYKTPFIILKNHPNFEAICAILNIVCEVACEVESAEIPTESKDEELKKVPTYYLTLNNSLKDLNLADLDNTYIPEYIDDSFKQEAVKRFNVKDIIKLWDVSKSAFKKTLGTFNNCGDIYDYSDELVEALKATVTAMAKKKYSANPIKSMEGYFHKLFCEQLKPMKDYLVAELRDGQLAANLKYAQYKRSIQCKNFEIDELPF
ncbi:hypothetical protein ABEW33_27410 [Priestia megaterium]|uniref:hypothetical protein n=1 Tax=Priestia megaterium TaxID=1404 RepID=UPI0030C97624